MSSGYTFITFFSLFTFLLLSGAELGIIILIHMANGIYRHGPSCYSPEYNGATYKKRTIMKSTRDDDFHDNDGNADDADI